MEKWENCFYDLSILASVIQIAFIVINLLYNKLKLFFILIRAAV